MCACGYVDVDVDVDVDVQVRQLSTCGRTLCEVTCLTALASSTPSKMKPKRSSHLHEGGAEG